MKLISCYIENFGGLQKFSYDFQSGLNVIYQENGWGKSTLAAFLKAMFYGMVLTTKRSVLENERKKYEPWNGGRYGGNLLFEAEGHTYRVERFWGIKDKADTFALYDMATGLKSDDYTENLGEELFGIDSAAFEQSIFMKQGMYSVSMTDSIASKMGGLMTSGNDLDCYEKAYKKLEDEAKKYKRKGDNGKISELMNEISILNRELDRGRQVKASIPDWKSQEEKCKVVIDKLYEQKEALKQQILKAGEQAGLKEKRKHYQALQQEKEGLRLRLEQMDAFFQNGVPTEEELEEQRKKIYVYKQNVEEIPVEEIRYRYPNLAKTLQKNPMTEEELDACEKKWNGLKEKQGILERKEIQLTSMKMRDEERLQYLNEKADAVKVKQNLFLILALVCFLVAVALFAFTKPLYGGLGIVVALIFLVMFLVYVGNRKKVLTEAGEEDSEILRMEEECKELSESIENGKKSVRMYLQPLSVDAEEEISGYFSKLRITLLEMTGEEEKRRNQAKAEQNRIQLRECNREELLLFLRRFYENTTEPEEYLLKEIAGKRNEYINLSQQYEAKCKTLEQTEVVEEISEQDILSVEELQKQELANENQIRTEETTLRQIQDKLDEYTEILEECEKHAMKKQDCEEVLAQYNQKYDLLTKTLKYLKNAQEDFSSRYLKKMNAGYQKYAAMLQHTVLSQSSMDVKLAIKTDENGTKREIGYYSVGTREMMELCARFALIEALFDKEQPFVVLDDPFVNMDEKALEGAKNILEQIAGSYQLIYFTCHSSRR